jgi:hypothetical protein
VPMTLSGKNFIDAAETFQRQMKEVHDVDQTIIDGKPTIVVTGIFEVFDPEELDVWGGRVRAVFTDNRPDADSQQVIGEMAHLNPILQTLLSAPTMFTLFKWTETVTRSSVSVDGGPQSVTVDKKEAWTDVTADFHRRAMREWKGGQRAVGNP